MSNPHNALGVCLRVEPHPCASLPKEPLMYQLNTHHPFQGDKHFQLLVQGNQFPPSQLDLQALVELLG